MPRKICSCGRRRNIRRSCWADKVLKRLSETDECFRQKDFKRKEEKQLTRQVFWYILWIYNKYCDRGALIISTLRDMSGHKRT